MQRPYKVKYKRVGSFFSKTEKDVIGHRYQRDQDKMVLYFSTGALKEIAEWSKCEIFLDVDWVLSTQKKKEEEAGQTIPLGVSSQ